MHTLERSTSFPVADERRGPPPSPQGDYANTRTARAHGWLLKVSGRFLPMNGTLRWSYGGMGRGDGQK